LSDEEFRIMEYAFLNALDTIRAGIQAWRN
jgi:hypothetical protein